MTRNAHECAYRRAREPQATNVPPGPSKVVALRGGIHAALADMSGLIATSDNLMAASREICSRMGLKTTRDPYADMLGPAGTPAAVLAVYHSLTHTLVLGARIAGDAVTSVSKRLAGNATALLAGVVVPPWEVQAYPEWCLARIGLVSDTAVGFEIYSGLAAGLSVDVRLFRNMAERLQLATGIATEKSLEAEFVHPAELYGTWLQLHIAAGTQLQLSDFKATQSLKEKNRKLREARRPDTRECPHSYAWECYACPLGAGDCPLAVRAKKPPLKPCKAEHEGFVEKGDLCVTCTANMWRAQRGISPLYLPPKIHRKEPKHVDDTAESTRSGREGHHLDVPVT